MSERRDPLQLFLIFCISFILLLGIVSMTFIIYKVGFKYDDDCLEKIARKICQERDLKYKSHFVESATCVEDLRVINAKEFRFLDHELERCEK